MTTHCPECGDPVIIAAKYGSTLAVDLVPDATGDLTLTRYSATGGWFARQAKPTPYARQTALYRAHACGVAA